MNGLLPERKHRIIPADTEVYIDWGKTAGALVLDSRESFITWERIASMSRRLKRGRKQRKIYMTNFWRHITRKNIRMLRNEEKGQGIIAPVFYLACIIL